MASKISAKQFAKYLHRRIIMQLTIFAILTITMFSIVIVDAITNNLNLLWIVLGAVVGAVLGYVVGRAFKLNWHEDSQKVIMNIDRSGF
ncbi:MAG: hypothetical protein JWO07_181, partial [Candidatus Saccharibacteria bacterium]|nr:hypothetical protein [Candidatus Saccharibacteria bacterium]